MFSVAGCPTNMGKCGTLGNSWCLVSLGVRLLWVNTVHEETLGV